LIAAVSVYAQVPKPTGPDGSTEHVIRLTPAELT